MQLLPSPPLNDLGLPDRSHYRTGEVCKVLNMSSFLLGRQLDRSRIKPTEDGKGRLFTLDQIRRLVRVKPEIQPMTENNVFSEILD